VVSEAGFAGGRGVDGFSDIELDLLVAKVFTNGARLATNREGNAGGAGMGFDIRLPIGMMLSVLGALIGIYGFMTKGNDMYVRHSLGININLWWGIAMLMLGVGMLLLARRGSSFAGSPGRKSDSSTTKPIGH
jgi:hypothetical protein